MQHRSPWAWFLAFAVALAVLAPPAPAAASYQSGFDSCYYAQQQYLANGTRWTTPNPGNVAPDFLNGCHAGITKANQEHALKPKTPTPTNPTPTNPTPTNPNPADPTPPNPGGPQATSSNGTFWLILSAGDPKGLIRRGGASDFGPKWSLDLLTFQPPAPPAGTNDGLESGYEIDLSHTPYLHPANKVDLMVPAKEPAVALGFNVEKREGGTTTFKSAQNPSDSFSLWLSDGISGARNCEQKTWTHLGFDFPPNRWAYARMEMKGDRDLIVAGWMFRGGSLLTTIWGRPDETKWHSCDPFGGRGIAVLSEDGKALAVRTDSEGVKRLQALDQARFQVRSFAGLKPAPPSAEPEPNQPLPEPAGGQVANPGGPGNAGALPGNSTGTTPGGSGSGLWSDSLDWWGSSTQGSTGSSTGTTTGSGSTGLWSDDWSWWGSSTQGSTGSSTGTTAGSGSTGLWSESLDWWGSSTQGSTGSSTGTTSGNSGTGLWSESLDWWGSSTQGSTGSTGSSTGTTAGSGSTGLWSDDWSWWGSATQSSTGTQPGTSTATPWIPPVPIPWDIPTLAQPPAPEPQPTLPTPEQAVAKGSLHYAAVFINDEHVTSIPVPTVSVTTVAKRADFYLALNPDGTARAIWTVLNVTSWNTIPVNIEYRGTYTLNPLRVTLTLQPAPKGWDTLVHHDPTALSMVVTGTLSADKSRILDLNIMNRPAKSGEAWQVDRTPGPGRPE